MKYFIVAILLTFTQVFAADNIVVEQDELSNKQVEIVIGDEQKSNSNSKKVNEQEIGAQLKKAKILATVGLVQYSVGLGIKYGSWLDLISDTYITTSDRNKAFTLSIISSSLQVSGPIIGGVGASLAYDNFKKVSRRAEKNTNWRFAYIGWACAGSSILTEFLAFRSVMNEDLEDFVMLRMVSFGLGIAADALFLTSVINAKKYTRNVGESVGFSNLEIKPYLDFNKNVGAMLSLNF